MKQNWEKKQISSTSLQGSILEGHFQGKHLMLVEITKVVKHLHTKVI
jgi:hypothetical protein